MNIVDYIGGLNKIKFLYENLNEGLIKTYDIETCENEIKNKFNNVRRIYPTFDNPYYETMNCYNKKDYFYVEIYKDFFNYRNIEKYIYNLCGWWTSFVIVNVKDKRYKLRPAFSVEFKNYSNEKSPKKIGTNLYLDEYFDILSNHEHLYIDTIDLLIEQKFTSTQTLQYGTALYHVTNLSFLQKIIKKGFIPKNRTNHPDRIYFTKDFNYAKSIKSEDDNYLIFRLNFKDYFNEIIKNFTFYDDPHHIDSIFTLDNIHPKYIQILLNDKWVDILDLTNEQINKIINN